VPILLTAYSVNQTDGSLTSFQSVPTSNANSLLYTDNQGHALYNLTIGAVDVVHSCGDMSIWNIDPATGRLTSLNSSLGTPCTPFSMSLDPGSNRAYLTIQIYGPYSGVYGAVVDPNTGNLTVVAGPSAASYPRLAVVEPSQGKFLFVYGLYGSYAVYSIDPSTGAISPMSGSTGSVPVGNVVRMVIAAAVN
jgi:6-phosphogluconolactonase (cycloisomerase 2 family)